MRPEEFFRCLRWRRQTCRPAVQHVILLICRQVWGRVSHFIPFNARRARIVGSRAIRQRTSIRVVFQLGIVVMRQDPITVIRSGWRGERFREGGVQRCDIDLETRSRMLDL